MRNWIKNHKAATAVLGALTVGLAAWLAFGYFGVQALFTNNKVDEAGPAFSNSAPANEPTATGNTDAGQTATQTEASQPAGGISTVAKGTFAGADSAHNVEGTASVLTDGSTQRFLRFTGFKATNGPDLFVYLRATDGKFINLGKLKGNEGDQNYEIPAEVDLKTYSTVQIWCNRFSVNFGSAELA